MRQIEEMRYLVLAAQREGSRMFTDMLQPMGITTSQSEVIRVLFDFEPLSLIELGDLLICETGSPSRLVNRLVKDGFVTMEKSKEDSRKVKLSLSYKGRVTAKKIIEVEEAVYDSISAKLKGAPVKSLIALLWKQVQGKPAGNALERRISGKSRK
ncbi:MAG: MarR family transcriptional regulator [Ignavibacteria bacterium]|nr:MarR family transcriptional regulator [Ignavibacteria bacterium]